MNKWIRNWIKRHFCLYDIEDLTIGGHCGCCGAWIHNEIVPEDWPYSLCQNCIKGVEDEELKG